jgi:hypothetical protein
MASTEVAPRRSVSRVTLNDDVLTDVEVRPHATNPTSRAYQQAFANSLPRVVVGKRIDKVQVGRLAGASGVPIGFNDAILHIRAEARELISAR